jgi:heterodisulfide reductase subunit A-like polyferredoxin
MKQIAIIGAGVAGIEAASIVSKNNFKVLLFEKENDIAGNIMNKARLFPDFSLAVELVNIMRAKINHPNISLHLNSEIVDIVNHNNEWELTDKKGTKYKVDTVLLATGYTPFDATLKEELGYGIYNGVITSLDLEKMFQENRILNSLDEPPGKIFFCNALAQGMKNRAMIIVLKYVVLLLLSKLLRLLNCYLMLRFIFFIWICVCGGSLLKNSIGRLKKLMGLSLSVVEFQKPPLLLTEKFRLKLKILWWELHLK